MRLVYYCIEAKKFKDMYVHNKPKTHLTSTFYQVKSSMEKKSVAKTRERIGSLTFK